MRISYNNKRKLFTISFHNRILETIQLEISHRGYLLWVITPKTVRVFGFWNSRKFYQHWENNHVSC